jgi:hypothetical protein
VEAHSNAVEAWRLSKGPWKWRWSREVRGLLAIVPYSMMVMVMMVIPHKKHDPDLYQR